MAEDERNFPRINWDLGEEGMPSCPAPEDWRAELVWAHHRLFQPPEAHPELAEGLPDCGIGWLSILDRLCTQIQYALEEEDGNVIKIVQIKEKHGTLRVYWEGPVSAPARAKVEKIIELACACSACTCEICGDEGRLYRRGDWLATACALHAKGEPVPIKPGFENIHIVRGEIDGKSQILSCRRYNPRTNSFADVSPASLGLKQ
ncbi:hypothetical protein [Bradyrhizobium sp. AS23.2]|uniref:hypothetical protein n=1 Tax=Bradyrhizobium sp. AS23.2 TaxID=1680155 RepID=UPI000965673A|nr:hypothetical protein [Bradyrhizobium sp. AS23.2]OKO79822.1 hypothetical protein AC630_16790 [Bradyrhizobium sp. AS23.2]